MLCHECNKRDLCTDLCPEAEVYADQDWGGLKEITIGSPSSFPRGHGDIDGKLVHKYLGKLYKLSRKRQVITLLDKGLTRAEITQLLGITRNNLRQIIKDIKDSNDSI
jgi:hypothetical protein